MTDLAATITPKSDQLNADDLIAGPRTIVVTRVDVVGGDQPVEIYFEGDGGKPYKPGKSMRRVLVILWGAESAAYVGRAMTLYRDPNVKFGGMAVGGIRISHMSHIDGARTMPLTETRGKKAPFTVKPLSNVVSRTPARDAAPAGAPSSLTSGAPADLIAPCPIGEMTDAELQRYGKEVRDVLAAADAARQTDVLAVNADDLLRLKARSPKLHSWILEPVHGPPGVNGGAPDGAQGAGAPPQTSTREAS